MSLAPVCKVDVKTIFSWQERYQSIRLPVPIPILVIRQQREQILRVMFGQTDGRNVIVLAAVFKLSKIDVINNQQSTIN